LSKQVKVSYSNEDPTLLHNLTIFRTLRIRNFYATGP
jgi:hypothetical protein